MWHRFAAWWRGWRYHWSPVTRLEPVRVGEGDPRFGSMSLDGEREVRGWICAGCGGGPIYGGTPPWCYGCGPNAVTTRGLQVLPASTTFLPAAPPTDAEVAASRAAHGYIPELDAEHPQGPKAAAPWGVDPGPGAGSSSAPGPAPALNVALPGPGVGDGIEWAVNPVIGPHIERLADTGDIRDAGLLADVTAYMAGQDADVTDWLAGRAMTWARLEIGALT